MVNYAEELIRQGYKYFCCTVRTETINGKNHFFQVTELSKMTFDKCYYICNVSLFHKTLEEIQHHFKYDRHDVILNGENVSIYHIEEDIFKRVNFPIYETIA